MGETCTYDDFLVTVEKDNQELVRELHEELTKLGCRAEIRQAKSGFVVSYLKNKKTILNYVFRKKGLMARIYPNHMADYMEVFDDILKGQRLQKCRSSAFLFLLSEENRAFVKTLLLNEANITA